MIWILLIIAIIAFVGTTFFRHWHDSDVLILVAIGTAINANIFNSNVMPIEFCGLTFGIDSVLYTLFMFMVIIKAKDYSVKSAKSMALTTICAILVSAIIELCAYWSFEGFTTEALYKFNSYIVSCIGTFAGIWAMLWLFQKLEKDKCNLFLNFALCVLLASIVNSFIYFGGMALVEGKLIENFAKMLLGSYIGKIASIILGLMCYTANISFWKPRNVGFRNQIKNYKN